MTDHSATAATPEPLPRAATGSHTTNGTPHGYTSLTPHIVVSPAAKALEFYRDVFGIEVLDVTRFGDTIAHAVVRFTDGFMTLSDPIDDYGLTAPSEGNVTYSLALYTPDTDSVVERATAAGATVREPASTFVTGDRYASLPDPFGVRWSVMTRVEDLSFDESAQRVAEWAASQG